MATTGTALFPGASTFPNTNVYPGQGTQPIIRCLHSTDDVSVSTPTWTDRTTQLRSYATSRGRNSELDHFDAGTASIVFDNRDRSLDPLNNAAIKPLNRLWLYEEFSGERQDLFRGYAESWTQAWDPSGIVDATATASCAEEFKVLSLARLPTSSPPRDTYADVIQQANPGNYWQMGDAVGSYAVTSTQGQNDLHMVAGATGTAWSQATSNPINGISKFSTALGNGVSQTQYGYLTTGTIAAGEAGDVGLNEFAIECWFQTDTVAPAGGDTLIVGPEQTAGNPKWSLALTSGGAFQVQARNSVPTTFTVTGPANVQANVWYHLIGTVDGGTLSLYVNGVSVGTPASFTGSFSTALTATAQTIVGDPNGAISFAYYSDIAFYRFGLNSAQAQAHYIAGTQRGFPQQTSGERVIAILDVAGTKQVDTVTGGPSGPSFLTVVTAPNRAPRSIQTGVRSVSPRYMTGQDPLGELGVARDAEAVDAAFFCTGSGGVKFLASDHRSSSPYNTSQATYGDGGGAELPYRDCSFDYSEAFLFNEWNVTRAATRGDIPVTQTSSDSASISSYFRRSQSLTDLALVADSDATTVAAAMLVKYKDPMTRVTSIQPNMADAETARVTYQRELMDRITVKRRPPGGGSAISQDLFIQRIEHSGAPGVPPTCTLGVSPL